MKNAVVYIGTIKKCLNFGKYQKHGEVKIEYNIIKEQGPDHDKLFTAEVKYNNIYLETGEGKTKKAAEMEAARKAIEKLKIIK